MSQSLHLERQGQILIVTLDRPKANAIDAATSREMSRVFEEFRDDPDLRVAILTGGGERFFSAGWDLKAAAEGEASESDYGKGGFGGITELWDLKKPVIVAMNGLAVGGGFELALAGDLVVAADHVRAWLPEVRLGILPDAGGVLRLPRRIPRALAMELLMTAREIDAAEMLRIGLVNRVVPAAELMAASLDLAEDLLQAAPLSLAAVKEIVNGTEDLSLEAATAKMRGPDLPTYRKALASEDAQEGPAAFAEKRAPQWQGR
ncbi:MAG: enoyl-CoA hydratase-related protein [Kiloniellales bacterium]